MFEYAEHPCYNNFNYKSSVNRCRWTTLSNKATWQSILCITIRGALEMKIVIIDVDLIGRQKRRFPNLACEHIDDSNRD